MLGSQELEDLQVVADIHEKTASDTERAKVLCQLAESLDSEKLTEAHADLEQAYNFPSLSKDIDKATAKRALDRIKAVREFKEAVEEAGE